MSKKCSLRLGILFAMTLYTSALAVPLKPRVVVLTDIPTWETDDHESLIRFLAHADLFEIEGLVISTGYSISTLTQPPMKDFIHIAHGVVDDGTHNLSAYRRIIFEPE